MGISGLSGADRLESPFNRKVKEYLGQDAYTFEKFAKNYKTEANLEKYLVQ